MKLEYMLLCMQIYLSFQSLLINFTITLIFYFYITLFTRSIRCVLILLAVILFLVLLLTVKKKDEELRKGENLKLTIYYIEK